MGRIPILPEGQLKVLFNRIRPMMRFQKIDRILRPSDSGDLYFLIMNDPNTILDREPIPGNRAANVAEFRRIKTYHCWSTMAPEVHPTSAEVLAQIPPDILNQIVAFEVVMSAGPGNIEGDHIRTETILYRKIKRQGER